MTNPSEAVELTDAQLVQSFRDHYEFARVGPWQGVQTPHYALMGLFKMAADRIEALSDRCAEHKALGIFNDPCCPHCPAPQQGVEAVREALRRQCDNMAFVLNRVDLHAWGDKFEQEMTEDRQLLSALRPSPDSAGNSEGGV
jgi:hypothetical protein